MSTKAEVITAKNGTKIELQVLTGTVLSASSHTEFTTHRDRAIVVGNKVTPGQVYNVAHNIEDVWIQREDGKEQKLPFSSALIDVRPGHEVLFLHSKNKQGRQQCVAAWNKTTDQVCTGRDAAREVLYANEKTSWFGSLIFWGSIALAASPLLFITNGDQRTVAAFVLFGVVVFNLLVTTSLNNASIGSVVEGAKKRMVEIQARDAA